MFTRNGFLHHFLTGLAVTGLGEILNALMQGPTGGTAQFLGTHPTVAVGVAVALPVVTSYVKNLLAQLSVQPGNVVTSTTDGAVHHAQ